MMEFLGLKKKKAELTGQSLIWDVASKFSGMIEQLEKGVAGCRVEQEAIVDQMNALEIRNLSLTNSVRIGIALSDKLADLMK